MKQFLKWFLPALILVEAALVWLDVLNLKDAVLVVIIFEVLLVAVAGHQTVYAVREYRRNRASGLDVWKALEDGLTILLPRPAARLVVTEPRLFLCLAKWIFRRTRLREGEFSYHKRSTMDMLILMVVLVSPVEVLVIELLLQAFLPLLWLRALLLFLAIYAVLWILGFHASRVTLPHRLEGKGLRVRHGVFAEGFIPYANIQGVLRTHQKAPKWGDGLQKAGEEAFLAIGGNTDITLKLRSPISLQGFLRATEAVNTIHLAADEPGQLSQELEQKLGSTMSGEKLTAEA